MPRKPHPDGIEEEVFLPSDDPYRAAAMFLAVMAYPGKDEGLLGAPGAKFCNAMLMDLCRQDRRANPQRYFGVKLPTQRDIQGDFMRGVRRIQRRLAARELAAHMTWEALGAFTDAPLFNPTPARIRANQKPIATFVSPNLEGWAAAFSERYRPPVVGERGELLKKLRANNLESLPVLHMAQALYNSAPKGILADRSMDLAAVVRELIACAPEWIWQAVRACQDPQALIMVRNLTWLKTRKAVAFVRVGVLGDGN